MLTFVNNRLISKKIRFGFSFCRLWLHDFRRTALGFGCQKSNSVLMNTSLHAGHILYLWHVLFSPCCCWCYYYCCFCLHRVFFYLLRKWISSIAQNDELTVTIVMFCSTINIPRKWRPSSYNNIDELQVVRFIRSFFYFYFCLALLSLCINSTLTSATTFDSFPSIPSLFRRILLFSILLICT